VTPATTTEAATATVTAAAAEWALRAATATVTAAATEWALRAAAATEAAATAARWVQRRQDRG
jgi:hypothetical protein